MRGNIRAVIFDLGGVLVGFKGNAFVPQTGSYVPMHNNLDWTDERVFEQERLFELGKLSPREFYKRILPLMKTKVPFSGFVSEWADFFVYRPQAIRLLKKLKAHGYKIGILSNTNITQYNAITSHYGLESIADAIALSFRVGSKKPEKEIFEAAAKGLREAPENCVYIDDLQKYADAARGYGFNAIQFKNPKQLEKELFALGIPGKRIARKPLQGRKQQKKTRRVFAKPRAFRRV